MRIVLVLMICLITSNAYAETFLNLEATDKQRKLFESSMLCDLYDKAYGAGAYAIKAQEYGIKVLKEYELDGHRASKEKLRKGDG